MYVSNKFQKVGDALNFCGVVSDLDTLRKLALECEAEEQYYTWNGNPDLKEQVVELYRNDVVPTQVQLNPFDWVIGLAFPLGDKKIQLRVVSDEIEGDVRVNTKWSTRPKRFSATQHTRADTYLATHPV
jgi:hypothetical protein